MSGFRFEKRGDKPNRRHRLKLREHGRAYSMIRAAYARYGETLLGITDEGRMSALRSVADEPATIDIATLFLILQLAMKLWMWWNKEGVTSPPERPGAMESQFIGSGGSEKDE